MSIDYQLIDAQMIPNATQRNAATVCQLKYVALTRKTTAMRITVVWAMAIVILITVLET